MPSPVMRPSQYVRDLYQGSTTAALNSQLRLDFPAVLHAPGLSRSITPVWTSPGYYARLDFPALLRPPGLPRITTPAWTSPLYYACLDFPPLLRPP